MKNAWRISKKKTGLKLIMSKMSYIKPIISEVGIQFIHGETYIEEKFDQGVNLPFFCGVKHELKFC